jgi:Spy/CpxP family protein refolding chaperone
MSRIRSMVVGLLVVASAAGIAEAQAPQQEPGARKGGEAGRGRRGGLEQRGMRALFRGINLSEAEKASLKTVSERYRSQFAAIRQSMRPDIEAARAARQRGDTAGARTAFARTADERAQLESLTERMRADARAALAPEHRAQFDANVARIKERMAARRKGDGFGGRRDGGKRARRALEGL